MLDLTLRSSWADRPPTSTVDDFLLRDGEKVVGRIYRPSGPQQHWLWGVLGVEIETPRGHAVSLEEARVAFKVAYVAWLHGVPFRVSLGTLLG